MRPIELHFYTKTDEQTFPKYYDNALELIKIHVIEGQISQNRTGVILELVDTAGNKFYAQTTARLIVNGIASGIRGFTERVGDDITQP